jgi:hypothetical protein
MIKKIIHSGKIVPFERNFKSIMGLVDFFSTFTKAILNVNEIVRNTENTLILENVIPEPDLSPVSKYDEASKRNVIPKAKIKAPFMSSFLLFDREKGFVSCSMLLGLLSVLW